MTARRDERAGKRVAVAVVGEDGRIRSRDTLYVGDNAVVGAVAYARGVGKKAFSVNGWEAHAPARRRNQPICGWPGR